MSSSVTGTSMTVGRPCVVTRTVLPRSTVLSISDVLLLSCRTLANFIHPPCSYICDHSLEFDYKEVKIRGDKGKSLGVKRKAKGPEESLIADGFRAVRREVTGNGQEKRLNRFHTALAFRPPAAYACRMS